MLTLFHNIMSTPSRFVRLALAEYEVESTLIEERPWAKRREFLAINPAGTLPVLLAEHNRVVPGGMIIAEYLDETRGVLKRDRRLFAEDPFERAEIRRLCDWFLTKLENEVTRHQMTVEEGGGAPDSSALRAARGNIKQHMKYLNWLAGTRNWLAGAKLSYADLTAAAAISILDYLGEIDWKDAPAARDWYVRMKSRPAFRPLLSDRVRGLNPVSHYADLDF
jgi:glutathione S-transferase